MSKLKLDNVTLIVIEGRNSHMDMTLKAKNICKWYIDFADIKVLTPQSQYDDKDIFPVNRDLDTLQKYNLFAICVIVDKPIGLTYLRFIISSIASASLKSLFVIPYESCVLKRILSLL